jgi:hypothetical protein
MVVLQPLMSKRSLLNIVAYSLAMLPPAFPVSVNILAALLKDCPKG